MNEEIKEILDYLKRSNKNKFGFEQGKLIDYEETQLLLDYITNLQQKDFESQKEITKLKDKLEQQRKEYQDTYKDVRIEIKEKNEQITNLQQDLDKANDIIAKDRQFYKCRMDEYVELKKENEFLKLNNPEMNIEHFRIVKENKRKIDNLRKENERLNNIINELEEWAKTNQYIGKTVVFENDLTYTELLGKIQELKESDDK